MAEKLGEGLLTALEERPVSISVAAKKKGDTTTTSKGSSQFGRMETALLAGTDAKKSEAETDAKKSEAETDAKKSEAGTDAKKSEAGTDAKKSEAGTDAQQREAARQKEVTQRFQDLGLGRGVDASRAKPWLIKTSFQVRPLRFDKLIGTEQGGTVEAYEDEVKSVEKLQFELKQSVSAPNVPVNIGADADHFRSATNMRRVVGRRVHNRTISIREDFDDMPVKVGRVEPSDEVTQEGKEEPTFEERLAKWVLERLHPEWEGDGSTTLKEWFEKNNSDKTLEKMYDICLEFVRTFHVTHYVSSVDLGALEYRVITEEEYSREIGLAGSLGLEDVVAAVLKTKGRYTSERTHTSSRIKRVGHIKNPDSGDYYVPRGTYAEAVIGVEVKPIHVLIRHQDLRQVLRHAVTRYIEDQRDTSVGPFFIISDSIDRETVYLSVNGEEDMSLRATNDKREASEFFIYMTDEGRNVKEFHIVYKGKPGTYEAYQPPTLTFGGSKRGATERSPPHHYLSTPLSAFGSNNGPLNFELNPKKSHTTFVLHNRLRTWRASAEEITPWVQGHEEYFINCYSRKFAHDGYLAVRRVLRGETVRYDPVCVPSRRPSDEYFKVFSMLLVPTEKEPPTASELRSSPRPRRRDPLPKDGIQMQSSSL